MPAGNLDDAIARRIERVGAPHPCGCFFARMVEAKYGRAGRLRYSGFAVRVSRHVLIAVAVVGRHRPGNRVDDDQPDGYAIYFLQQLGVRDDDLLTLITQPALAQTWRQQ